MHPDPLRWLYDLQHFGVKLGLDNIRALLDLLGHPERDYPSVLVGGTNGKGSVAAMLSAMLEAAGLPAGLFTSPHLVRPEERIRIGDRDVAGHDLRSRLDRMRRTIEAGVDSGRLEVHPSFFEVFTATALQAFRDAGVAAGVLEVGLGGRLDATNAVEAELAVVVTIELDHVKTLGTTVEQIAVEKAGIVKGGRPVVTGVERSGPLRVLRDECRRRDARLIEAPRAASIARHSDGSFDLRTRHASYADLRLALAGAHQVANARVAAVAFETLLERLGRTVEPAVVREGLARVRWPGRLQWIDDEPPLLLDGAHNPAGAEVLAQHLRALLSRTGEPRRAGPGRRPLARPPVLLFGAMKGKDVAGMVAPLEGLVGPVVVTQPDVQRSADVTEVAEVVGRVLDGAERVVRPAEALERARALAGDDSFVLVAGSLYLVGQILGLLEPEPVAGPVSL